jgi:hypothetical protein
MLRAWALFVFTAFLGLAVPAFAGAPAGAAAAFALSSEIAADEPDVPLFVSSGESSMTSWQAPVSRVNWFGKNLIVFDGL